MDAPFARSRLLHTMLRVVDLERSVAFYTTVLGMKLLRRRDYHDGCFTLAFLGYDHEAEATVLELTHNWDQRTYDKGMAYGLWPYRHLRARHWRRVRQASISWCSHSAGARPNETRRLRDNRLH